MLETQTPNVHTETKTETEPCSVHPVAAKPGSVTQNGGWPGPVGDGFLADLWQHSTNSHQTSTGHRDVLQGVQHLLEVLASCGLRTMTTPWDINESSTAGAGESGGYLVESTENPGGISTKYAVCMSTVCQALENCDLPAWFSGGFPMDVHLFARQKWRSNQRKQSSHVSSSHLELEIAGGLGRRSSFT